MRGSQGHAGTVPMSMRQDPMPAAAEAIVLLESLCKRPEDFLSYDGHCKSISLKSLSSSLVCTVGEITTWPSASNVIPGQARSGYLENSDFDSKSKIEIFFYWLSFSMKLKFLFAGYIYNRFTHHR